MRKLQAWLRGAVPVLTLAGLMLSAPAAIAQTTGATLEGRVVDDSGAAVPGASVTVLSPQTGFKRTALTDAEGRYRFTALPAGTYDVSTELSGFKSVEQKGVVLNVATLRALDVKLSVAGIEEAVTVSVESPLVQSEPANGTVVSQRELENLPLNGRQFANLGVLAPGTSLAYNSDPTKP